MLLNCPVEWLFFDVGNVLLDERTWLAHYHTRAFEALRAHMPQITRERFDEERRRGEQRTDCTPMQHVFAHFIPDPDRALAARQSYWQETVASYYELSTPAEGVYEVLDALRPRFRLGIIANQQAAIHGWMARHDLATYFSPAVYDCDLGVAKPDPRHFTCALEQASCPPGRAVMIGDRLDNDIRPARQLGMWTVRVRAFGDYARFEPSKPEETPHATISNIRYLPTAIEEICRLAAN